MHKNSTAQLSHNCLYAVFLSFCNKVEDSMKRVKVNASNYILSNYLEFHKSHRVELIKPFGTLIELMILSNSTFNFGL